MVDRARLMHDEYMFDVGLGQAKSVGLFYGLGLTLLIGAFIFPLRSHDYELRILFVVPVVVAGALSGRRASLLTAAGAVVCFHISRLSRIGQSAIAADVVAAGTFLICALIVGTTIGNRSDRLLVAAQREEEVRLRVLSQQAVADKNRMALLEQVDQQRSALLRSVSHDLRTPLATIRAVSTDLQEDIHAEVVRHEMLDSITREAERMDRLVANLLSMSRIEAGALRVDSQAVDFGELVHSAALGRGHQFRHRKQPGNAVRKEVLVDGAVPLVAGDPVLLDEVVNNLVENAERFAPAGSTITLEVQPAGNGHVCFRIVDRGPGIAVDDVSHLFDPFWSSPKSRSSGLGLAIVKAVVEAHSGTVSYAPTPGGGATFEVLLPRHLGISDDNGEL